MPPALVMPLRDRETRRVDSAHVPADHLHFRHRKIVLQDDMPASVKSNSGPDPTFRREANMRLAGYLMHGEFICWRNILGQ